MVVSLKSALAPPAAIARRDVSGTSLLTAGGIRLRLASSPPRNPIEVGQ
jgi:hypothetical protein